jgi:hypothetical protein
MVLFQLVVTTTETSNIAVNLSGRYRVKLTGFDVRDNTTNSPNFTFINSVALNISKACVGMNIRGLAFHSLGFVSALVHPIDLGICEIPGFVDVTMTSSVGVITDCVILSFDVERVN